MTRTLPSIALAALLLAGAAPAAQPGPGEHLAFVACPIVRDTAHPCWLAEYQGELYYLGPQGGSSSPFIAPQLRHRALVEGRLTDAPRICGGRVLEDVTASVLPEVDDRCNTILPADDHPDPPTVERGPAPTHRDNTRLRRRPPIEDLPQPFVERDYQVQFTFDVEEAFIGNPSHTGVRPIQAAARHALALGDAARVRITGHRARVRLSDGSDLFERADIAQRRARYLVQTLHGLGVPAQLIEVLPSAPVVGDRPTDRRAVIQVSPASP
ncbi:MULTISPECIES: hypothetical protein [unclassified Luteimonas]